MSQARVSVIRPLLACGLLMEAALVLIHFARTPSEQVALVLLSYLIGGSAYAWLLWTLRNADRRSPLRAESVILILAAALFRLTLFPLPPATSPDVNRYLWEGLVQMRGHNPYVLAPTAEEFTSLAAEHPRVWGAINHPDLPAIYPPSAQLLFLCNALLFGGSLWGWKVILLLFDGILAGALVMVLKGRSRPMVWLAGVLWCPLLLLETYEGGHLDVIGAALMVLALVALGRGRVIVCGIALGLAINVKYLWPLLLLVLLAAQAARQRRGAVLVGVTLAVAAASWLPYRSGLGDAVATARMFAESWTFNDLIFEALRRVPGPRWMPMACVLTFLVGLAGWRAWRARCDIWPDVWLLGGTALLFGPVAYPWYFIWIVPGLALRPPLWLVIWVLSVPLLHVVDWRHVSTGEWDPMYCLWPVVTAIPAALLITSWRRRARGWDA